MNMLRYILLAVFLLLIGLVCDTAMIRRVVEVPVDQWQIDNKEIAKDGNAIHNLLFVSQHDAAEAKRLKQIGDEVSYPDSDKYGQFMTYDEVYQLVLPTTTKNGHVLEHWARTNGLTVTQTTKNKQYIMVEASVNTVERVFQTKLQQYKHIETGQSVLRSTSFVLPSDIYDRVALIDGLSHFPVIQSSNRIVNHVTQASNNAPNLFKILSGFGHYLFYILPRCNDGSNTSTSLCDNQFDGFQIHLSGQSKPYNISAAQANCEICSCASGTTKSGCQLFYIASDDVLCVFYLMQDGSVPLYEPHTFTVRTRFLTTFSQSAAFTTPTEKVIDITPPVLRSLYNVDDSPTATRDHRIRQAVAEFREYLDMKSFEQFAKHFGKKYKLVFGKIYGYDYRNNQSDEFEESLDTQYMASMGSHIPMDYISATLNIDFILSFFIQLALIEENKRNVVPLVYSISYGEDETHFQAFAIEAYELQFLIMSVTGKTVFVASGDTGSTGNNGRCRKVSVPPYPASSVYVTSVGATEFVSAKGYCSRKLKDYCLEEVAAEASILTGSLVTTGGGFSNSIRSPRYQHKAVQNYLLNPANPLPPNTFYHRHNRGYPDVSLAGHQYLIKVFGNTTLFGDGTSASSPVIACLVSLIVDRRLILGMQPLGLLNPLLYNLSVTHPEVFYDITKGNNSCNPYSPVCCQYSFVASKGWDPLTGLGSINHRELIKQLTKQ